MSQPGLYLDRFEQTLKESNEWLKDISLSLQLNEPEESYAALRAVLHALRNCLDLDAALKFGDKLPLLFKGLYYEGWHPEQNVNTVPATKSFEEHVESLMNYGKKKMDARRVIDAVFGVLSGKLRERDIEEIAFLLPGELAGLWKQSVVRRWTL